MPRIDGPAPDVWHLAGGAQEWDEPSHDAFKREMREELCVEVEVLSKEPVVVTNAKFFVPKLRQVTGLHYFARIIGGRLEAGDGISDVCWFTRDQVRRLKEQALLLPSTAEALARAMPWEI